MRGFQALLEKKEEIMQATVTSCQQARGRLLITVGLCVLWLAACGKDLDQTYTDEVYRQVKLLQAQGFKQIVTYTYQSRSQEERRRAGCLASDTYCVPFKAVSSDQRPVEGIVAFREGKWTATITQQVTITNQAINEGVPSDHRTVEISGEAWRLGSMQPASAGCGVKLKIKNVGKQPLAFDNVGIQFTTDINTLQGPTFGNMKRDLSLTILRPGESLPVTLDSGKTNVINMVALTITLKKQEQIIAGPFVAGFKLVEKLTAPFPSGIEIDYPALGPGETLVFEARSSR